MLELSLYTTEGCHLCEQAEALCSWLAEIRLHKVEIANDEELMTRYGVRIPVLRHVASDSELGWPFDEAQLRAWLEQL